MKRFAALDVESVSPTDWASLAAEIARTGNLRNSSTVAVPPTGRSAPVVGASTGIEPLFRLTDELTGRLRHGVVAVLREVGCEDLVDVLTVRGQLPDVDTVPASLRSVLATATQISPHGQLAMAAAVQACVDEAVSKTVNLPAAARSIDVYDTFATAWEMGCKGITVYVDGSRQTQPQAL